MFFAYDDTDFSLLTVSPVVEDDEVQVPNDDNELVTIPTNMADPNPNGTEFDCLYLDMNGIVCPRALIHCYEY